MTFDERPFWIFVIAVGATDVATTMYGLGLGLTEANPILRPLLESGGINVLVSMKMMALALAIILRPFLAKGERFVIPLALSIPWLGATVINVIAIASV